MTSKARRIRWAKPVAGVLGVGALAALPVLAGCGGVDQANAADAALERFTSCAALSKYAQENALAQVGAFGIGGGVVARVDVAEGRALDDAGATGGAVPAPTTPQSAAKSPGVDFSGTNVQEIGVDEPDIVKTDGSRVFAIAKNRLYAIDVSGPAPRVTSSIALPKDVSARDLLLAGDTVVVLGDGPVSVRPATQAQSEAKRAATDAALIVGGFGGSVITRVDVNDMAELRIVETFQSEARYVNARLTGTTARIVMVAGAPMGIDFAYPTREGAAALEDAERANRNALSRTTADNWVPRYTVTSGAGTSASQPLTECTAVGRPPTFSGLGMVTVLTVDLTRGLDPVDSDAVMAGGENIYASPQALYVATNRWPQPGPDGTFNPESVTTTEIHKFDTSGTTSTDYKGSGSVIGTLLNQFSMSEDEGVLRVATTEAGQGLVGGDAVVSTGGTSESYVTTLDERDGKLVQLGQVGGLGKDERIYAVRFIGKTGYVVTFKQTDPLYTVDLSDPAQPKVTGELKIAGYSAYLHPVDGNLLIGVGQDADENGRTKGLQISLFDVSDPASPKRLQNAVLPGANSDAEWDHRAFLWWPKSQLAVVPFQRYFDVAPQTSTSPTTGVPGFEAGALGMRVTREGISEAGRVAHPFDPQYGTSISRSFVIGDGLYTLSDAGIKVSNLSDLAERSWLPFS